MLVRLSIFVLKSAVSLPVVVLRCSALLKLTTYARSGVNSAAGGGQCRLQDPWTAVYMVDGQTKVSSCLRQAVLQREALPAKHTHLELLLMARQ